MIDFMGANGVFPKTIRVGNFRWEYFCQRNTAEVLSEGKNFLYAPTWDNDFFWKAFPHFAKRLPAECNLWVKFHPNTVRKFAPEIEVLIGRYSKQTNIRFLPDEPLIYPLLAECASYIGDMSSVGYDFLTFCRPMYFIEANTSLPLHQCGAAIDPAHFDFTLANPFAEAQKQLYDYTFGGAGNWKEQFYALCGI